MLEILHKLIHDFRTRNSKSARRIYNPLVSPPFLSSTLPLSLIYEKLVNLVNNIPAPPKVPSPHLPSPESPIRNPN